MKYWLDTEFIARPFTIDLISIGLVAGDGREFYAESSEVDVNSRPAAAGPPHGPRQIGGGSGGGAGCSARQRAMSGSSVSLRQNCGAPICLRQAAFQ